MKLTGRRGSRWNERTALGTYELHHGPNMTPMVDVVMVILVFFMASAAILGPEWFLNAGLVRRSATAPPTSENLVTVRVIMKPAPTPGSDASAEQRDQLSFEAIARASGSQQSGAGGADPSSVRLESFSKVFGSSELAQYVRTLGEFARERRVIVTLAPTASVDYESVIGAYEQFRRQPFAAVGVESDLDQQPGEVLPEAGP
ncbi:MAG: biopolymer transporter ExbD [Planctomycetota bacterium]|nr:biopolymer transporter ExbD [Planctomycetota bacterium]